MNGYCNTEGHRFSLLCKKHNSRDGLLLRVKAVAITYTVLVFYWRISVELRFVWPQAWMSNIMEIIGALRMKYIFLFHYTFDCTFPAHIQKQNTHCPELHLQRQSLSSSSHYPYVWIGHCKFWGIWRFEFATTWAKSSGDYLRLYCTVTHIRYDLPYLCFSDNGLDMWRKTHCLPS